MTVTGRPWALRLPDGTAHSGRVSGGSVAWPQTITDDSGCGAGVATFSAQLRAPKGESGSITGCLDDTHPSTVFPPHIWGQLTLGKAPAEARRDRLGPRLGASGGGSCDAGLGPPSRLSTDQEAKGPMCFGVLVNSPYPGDLDPAAITRHLAQRADAAPEGHFHGLFAAQHRLTGAHAATPPVVLNRATGLAIHGQTT